MAAVQHEYGTLDPARRHGTMWGPESKGAVCMKLVIMKQGLIELLHLYTFSYFSSRVFA